MVDEDKPEGGREDEQSFGAPREPEPTEPKPEPISEPLADEPWRTTPPPQPPPLPPPPPPPYSESYAPPPPPERDGPAWEWWPRLGFWRAMLMTIREVLGRPDETFSLARRTGGLGRPLVFYIVVGVLSQIIAFLLLLPFRPAFQTTATRLVEALQRYGHPAQLEQITRSINEKTSITGNIFNLLIVSPVGLLIGIFIFTGLTHLLLILFGGARYSFETTFRALAYAAGACAVLSIIPVCGGLIQTIALVVVGSIALVRMHETDTWRAVLAIITPGFLLVLCCCGIFGMFFWLMVAIRPTQ